MRGRRSRSRSRRTRSRSLSPRNKSYSSSSYTSATVGRLNQSTVKYATSLAAELNKHRKAREKLELQQQSRAKATKQHQDTPESTKDARSHDDDVYIVNDDDAEEEDADSVRNKEDSPRSHAQHHRSTDEAHHPHHREAKNSSNNGDLVSDGKRSINNKVENGALSEASPRKAATSATSHNTPQKSSVEHHKVDTKASVQNDVSRLAAHHAEHDGKRKIKGPEHVKQVKASTSTSHSSSSSNHQHQGHTQGKQSSASHKTHHHSTLPRLPLPPVIDEESEVDTPLR